MLQNIFSYRPPLHDLFNEAELRAFHPTCFIKSRTQFLKPINIVKIACGIMLIPITSVAAPVEINNL